MTKINPAILAAAAAGLCAAGISSPIMSMIDRSTDFYTIYQMTSSGILTFILTITVALPAFVAAFAVVCLKYRLSSAIGLLVLFTLMLITSGAAMRGIPDPTGGWIVALGAVLLAAAVLVGFLRYNVVRIALAATALHIPVSAFAAIYAAGIWDTGRTGAPAVMVENTSAASSIPNVVFLVLDEFPLTTILQADGNIDPVRFPNLRALADRSHWYRNASTVACNTAAAVPAILTGNLPEKPLTAGRSPTLKNYPDNLFTLLSGTHHVSAIETATHLCPEGVCQSAKKSAFKIGPLVEHLTVALLHESIPAGFEASLPDLNAYWMDAAAVQGAGDAPDHKQFYPIRVDQFDRFVSSIKPEGRPFLKFAHILLPHQPFEFLRNGKSYFKGRATYAIEERAVDGGGVSRSWDNQKASIDQTYFRHVEQSMFVDRLVGRLVDRLDRTKTFDNTVIVIVADHGATFLPGQFTRRTGLSSYGGVLPVPLIVKSAGQTKGEISDEIVQTIDILPTVLGSLKLKAPAEFDGRDLLAERIQPLAAREHFCGGADYQKYPLDIWDAALKEVARRDALFANGPQSDTKFLFNPHKEWLRKRVPEVGKTGASDGVMNIAGMPSATIASQQIVPLHLDGNLEGVGSLRKEALIAITLNGRIASVMPLVSYKGKNNIVSSFLLPSLLRKGSNEIRAYLVKQPGAASVGFLRLRLKLEGSSEAQEALSFKY